MRLPFISARALTVATVGMFLALAVKSAVGWTGGTPPSPGVVPLNGFIVNTASRPDVMSYYHTVYRASENAAVNMAWTGNYGTCSAGTTSAAFRDATLRRVNFFRGLAGVTANVTFDAFPILNSVGALVTAPAGTSKSVAAQQAALMMSAEIESTNLIVLDHNPDPGWSCYTTAGWNGANHGNLGVGFNGPEAIDAYILELEDATDIGLNPEVGHRRWILYSRARDMATGDVPEFGLFPAANCLYVIDTLAAAPTPKFVPWPPAGYSPLHLASVRWSLSYPGANFAAASVTMTTGAGATVGVTVKDKTSLLEGDNSITWEPAGIPVTTVADLVYNVTVTGIIGVGVPATHSYTVRLVNTAELGITPSLTGSATPPVSGALYTLNPVTGADGYDLLVMNKAAGTTYADGAESASTFSVVGNLPATQGAVSGSFTPKEGTKAFHLYFTAAKHGEQTIQLLKPFIPSSTSTLTFFTQSRFRAAGNKLSVQASLNNGLSWTEIWSQTTASDVLSSASPNFDTTWKTQTQSLASYANRLIWLRLVAKSNTGAYVNGSTQNEGYLLDQLTVSNCATLGAMTTTRLAAGGSSYAVLPAMAPGGAFTASSPYYLSYQPVMGSTKFDAAAPLAITPTNTTGYSAWLALQPAQVTTSGPNGDSDGDGIKNLVEYALGLDPSVKQNSGALPQPILSGGTMSMTLVQPPGVTGITYRVQFSQNLSEWETLVDFQAGSNHQFSKSLGAIARGYMRILIQMP